MPEIMPTRPQQITLLLVGPTGSGKTSFVNRVLDRTGSQEKRPKVRDGLHPCEYHLIGKHVA